MMTFKGTEALFEVKKYSYKKLCLMRQCVHQRMNAKVYRHMIYSPETKQNKTVRYLNIVSWNIFNDYIQMVIIHSNYILCARWFLFVTPDSSSSLPCCSMRVLSPPLLVINCLSSSPPVGSGPPPFHSGWPHFPQGPGTFPLLCRIQKLYWQKCPVCKFDGVLL
jgi:hypothetical protein